MGHLTRTCELSLFATIEPRVSTKKCKKSRQGTIHRTIKRKFSLILRERFQLLVALSSEKNIYTLSINWT